VNGPRRYENWGNGMKQTAAELLNEFASKFSDDQNRIVPNQINHYVKKQPFSHSDPELFTLRPGHEETEFDPWDAAIGSSVQTVRSSFLSFVCGNRSEESGPY
jgi:hypothetical protein